MLKSIFIIFLMSVCVLSCKKDKLHWQQVQQLITHTNNRLNKILLLPDGTGIIGGGEKFLSSEILISKNDGDTWEYYSIPEAGKGLYGLGCSPAGNIYLTGFDGKLISTSSQNISWKFTQINTWKNYVDVVFPENNKGLLISTKTYLEGSVDIIDTNGIIQSEKEFNFGLNDIEVVNPQMAYVSGYGAVLKTIDGGKNWNITDVKNDNFTAVHASGINEAWTCGYNGNIFHTKDGGNTWERKRNGNDLTKPRYQLLDILFTDTLHGYAIGEKGLFIYTDDGGNHWMEFDRFTDNALRSIVAKKDGSLLICGDNGSLYKVIPSFF